MQPLLVSMLAAAEAAPTDVTLRLHLVQLLREHGEMTEAIKHCGAALSVEPLSEAARSSMRELLGVPEPSPEASPADKGGDAERPRSVPQPAPVREERPTPREEPSAEQEDEDRDDRWTERVNVTLADVGGMDMAKERLEAAVLAPMRNPELRRLYRQSRTGGVLLYGPPGCGKTFLARATAGELDVPFVAVAFGGLAPEEQVEEIAAVFQAARDQAPVVLCLVGIEHLSSSAAPRTGGRSGVGALAAELDKGPDGNLGLTILGSTNEPWNVDPALRRPGRLEQTLLVLPPDRVTREVALRQQLGEHPEVDVEEIARRSSGYSGRDLAAAIRTAEARVSPVTTRDVIEALDELPPSARKWLEEAERETAASPDPSAYVGLREYIAARRERHP